MDFSKYSIEVLNKLGYSNIQDYRGSPKFAIAIDQYRRAGLPQKCLRCGNRGPYQYFHRRYDRLGHERPNDIVCLHETCFKKIVNMATTNKCSFDNAIMKVCHWGIDDYLERMGAFIILDGHAEFM